MATPRKNRNSSLKKKWKRQLIEKYGQRCWLCGAARNFKHLTLDHVLPLNLNGPDEKENMKLACAKCNGARGNAVTRLLIPGLHRKRIYSQFDLMLERMVFVERQLHRILIKGRPNG